MKTHQTSLILIMVLFLTIATIFTYKFNTMRKQMAEKIILGLLFEVVWCEFQQLFEIDREISKEEEIFNGEIQ